MRKFILFLIILVFFAPCFGCKSETAFLADVSDLRQNIYVGTVTDYTVTAYYGFREKPFVNDGKRGTLIHGYTVKLNKIADEIQRKIEINCGDEVLSAIFCHDQTSGEYCAFIATENYSEKTVSATLICGSDRFPVTLYTILPDSCLSYTDVLGIVSNNQKALFESYKSGEEFDAEIYMRVFVKNEMAYWYIGIASGNDKLKAFLADGKTGEVLAIRDIM